MCADVHVCSTPLSPLVLLSSSSWFLSSSFQESRLSQSGQDLPPQCSQPAGSCSPAREGRAWRGWSISPLLTIEYLEVRDFSGNLNNPVDEITGGDTGTDFLAPQAILMNFNANLGRLTITFTEPINVASLDLNGIILSSEIGSSGSVFSLAVGNIVTVSNSSIVVIELAEEDFNALKLLPEIARSMESTFVHIDEGSVADLSGNVIAVFDKMVTSFVTDSTPPMLLYWDFDLSYGNITLYLNEPVQPNIMFESFTIQNTSVSTATSVTLGVGVVVTTEAQSLAIEIQLATEDFNVILQNTEFCNEPGNCFLSFSSSAFMDVFNNFASSVPGDDATMVNTLGCLSCGGEAFGHGRPFWSRQSGTTD